MTIDCMIKNDCKSQKQNLNVIEIIVCINDYSAVNK